MAGQEPFPNANGDDDDALQSSVRDLLLRDLDPLDDERMFRLCKMVGVRRTPCVLLKAIALDNNVRWEVGKLDEGGVYHKIKVAHMDVAAHGCCVWLIHLPGTGMIRLVARTDGLDNVIWKHSTYDSLGAKKSCILHPE
jgi:hypothetical protein